MTEITLERIAAMILEVRAEFTAALQELHRGQESLRRDVTLLKDEATHNRLRLEVISRSLDEIAQLVAPRS